MARKPYLILLPLGAQGHVAPMMKLAYNLVHQGLKVICVNTVSAHSKIMSSLSHEPDQHGLLRLVSVPEPLKSKTGDVIEEYEKASRFLQSQLQNLIQQLIEKGEVITHVIADVTASWAFKVANELGIKAVAFVPFGLANFTLVLHIPKLIESGFMDDYGEIKEGRICVSDDILEWNPENLLWRYPYDERFQKYLFRSYFYKIPQDIKSCNTILANSFQQLEPAPCNLIPHILPIGPLSSRERLGFFAGNMWAEDSSCLAWLDQQPTGSVIYAAFGSSMVCSQQQVNELAFGLEITGRPFLWVVRSDFTEGTASEFPQGFIERVANNGKIVKWAPQEKVLAHNSIACFFSHCGWNSTMEGISKGVPFLCWPYLADQFRNRDDICETLRIGLKVVRDENGIVTRDEIKGKLEKLLCDEEIKANSQRLKEIAEESIREGGSSFANFKRFVDMLHDDCLV